MAYGILLLRVVLGLLMAAHGAQKLFGWFGGSGLRATAAGFGMARMRAPLLMALMAGLAEFAGGLLLALGLFTQLAVLAFVIVMVVAIATVHWKNGLFNSKRGYEYNLLIVAAAAAIAATGPGRYSLDAVLGLERYSGFGWALGVLAVGGVIGAAVLILGRRPAEPEAAPAARPEKAG